MEFSNSVTTESAKGFIGTQVLGQGGVQFNWAETSGIQAKVAHSSLRQGVELMFLDIQMDLFIKWNQEMILMAQI